MSFLNKKRFLEYEEENLIICRVCGHTCCMCGFYDYGPDCGFEEDGYLLYPPDQEEFTE